ncbi:MAG: UDP-N-acetylmuramoyl-L-alanyl-D-glutamate--2,6-diaminopimelate ligase [Gammaproteobacteria bacterium]|jgi:UDP-N-acetylmuramoyl-L-alanyl-D-glutamate--2,6-diaminopimelate ligase
MKSDSSKTLQQLLKDIATVDARDDCPVTGLSLDSRAVETGFLFFALSGHKEHGFKYATDAIKRGACAVVWEADSLDDDVVLLEPDDAHVPIIAVVNLKQQVGRIAERFYDSPTRHLYMIGITGTNGKTSCSQFLAQTLNDDAPTCVIGTLGNGFVGSPQAATHTTPDAVTLHGLLAQYRDQQAENVVMEVSSHGLSQGRVAGIDYDIAMFTNLSRDHLDYHGDMTAYGNAKKLLFDTPSLKTAIINVDDDFGRDLASSLQGKLQVIRYGITHDTDVDVRASKVRLDNAGLHFDVITPKGSGIVSSPLLGRFNVSNLLAVLAGLLVKGVRFEEAVARICRLSNVDGRMERVPHDEEHPLFVVDYAHTPDALAKALQSLRDHVDRRHNGKLWCVFGCGGDRDKGKRAAMGNVAEEYADHVIITDDNPRTEAPSHIVAQILDGIYKQQDVVINHDRVAAIGHAIEHAGPYDAILVAGKGHEAYQIIGTEKHDYAGDVAMIRQLLRQRKDSTGE